jgi:deoxyadenosine/deoxycytidine kinase
MYIVISGVHGIGKTTLARRVASELGGEFLPEVVDERIAPPVLGPGGNVILAELWMARQTMLKEASMRSTQKIYVADRAWADIRAYTEVLCTPHEREILFHALDQLPKRTPDVQLVVHAPMEVIMDRIYKRGRENLSQWNEHDEAYIANIQNAFLEYHNSFKDLRPIHLVDASGDIEANTRHALSALEPYLSRP